MIEDLKASDAQKSAEVDRLKRELHESHRSVRQSPEEINKVLAEKDHALAQATVEHLAAQHAKDKLEEEQIARTKLQEENARLRKSLALALAQSRITFLESEAYLLEAVEEYRQGIIEKAEVVLAYMAGFDYLEAQLPIEMRGTPSHFHYPPRVASCLKALEDIERQGGRLDLDAADVEDEDEDEADEAQAERVEERGESSVGQRDEGTESGSRSTPPPTTTSALPLTPGAGMDFAQSP